LPSSAGRNDVGGDKGEQSTGIVLHGGRGDDGRTNWDGMNANVFFGNAGGQQRVYYFNTVAVQEVVVDAGGNSAEIETGGANVNMVPKDGGNRLKLSATGNFTNNSFSATGVSDDLIARGATPTSSVKKIWDYGVGLGGPFVKDKLWFYTAHRWWGSQNLGSPLNFFNKSTNPFAYVPDTSRRAYGNSFYTDNAIRLTWQASPKQKLTQEEHLQHGCTCWQGIAAGSLASPEADQDFQYGPQVLTQTTWTYAATNRLLIQAGATFLVQQVNFTNYSGNSPNYFTGIGTAVFPGPNTHSITDVGTGRTWGAIAGGVISYGLNDNTNNYNQRLSVSYISGSHAFKTGLQTIQGNYYLSGMQGGVNMVNYTFNNGVPVGLTQFAGPFQSLSKVSGQAVFAQDQWTLSRLTLNVGVRFDRFEGHTLAGTTPAGGQFSVPTPVPEIDNVPNFKDITPRIGVSYDLFGNGKTAIKVAFGRYLYGQGGGLSQSVSPAFHLIPYLSRSWYGGAGVVNPATGVVGNGDFTPDCNLNSTAANGECGPLPAPLGLKVPTVTIANDASQGWGNREYNYQTSVQLQHELRPGVGIAVGYFRTSWGNFTVSQNAGVQYDQFCITAPGDPRLGSASGSQICGLPATRSGFATTTIKQATDLGLGTPSEIYNGIDIGFNARWGKGALVQGGISVGRESLDYCYANGHPELTPENFPTTTPIPGLSYGFSRSSSYCHVTSSWWNGVGSQAKLQAVYPLPWDLQVSGTFKSLPGLINTANLVVTNAQVASIVGHPVLDAGYAVALLPYGNNGGTQSAGTVYDQRLNETDLRLTKIVRIGRGRLQGNLDLYNVFNTRAPQAIFSTFNGSTAYRTPLALLGGRLLKFGGQIDF
jgi:hypothetical protein